MFFLHHAYVDHIWHDWQQSGGKNQFGGTHRKKKVSVNEVILPRRWGRTVAEIFTNVQPCVVYIKPHLTEKGVPFTSGVVHNSVKKDDINSASSFTLTFDKVATENAVVNKILNPISYKKSIVDAAVEEQFINSCAKKFSNIPDKVLSIFLKNRNRVAAQASNVLVRDMETSLNVKAKSSDTLRSEGLHQLEKLDAKGTL